MVQTPQRWRSAISSVEHQAVGRLAHLLRLPVAREHDGANTTAMEVGYRLLSIKP